MIASFSVSSPYNQISGVSKDSLALMSLRPIAGQRKGEGQLAVISITDSTPHWLWQVTVVLSLTTDRTSLQRCLLKAPGGFHKSLQRKQAEVCLVKKQSIVINNNGSSEELMKTDNGHFIIIFTGKKKNFLTHRHTKSHTNTETVQSD